MIRTEEEDDRLFEAFSKYKVKCKHCDHSAVLPVNKDKKLCTWCGNYIFRTPEIEFKYRLNQELKRKKVKNDDSKTVEDKQ